VFIEINFREAVDYNDTTGLMDINENIIFWKYPKELNIKGVSYRLISVKSSFSKGKFTQDLECRINTFPNTAESATGRGNSAVTTGDLARADRRADLAATAGGSSTSNLMQAQAVAEAAPVTAAPVFKFNAAKDSQSANDDSTRDRQSGIAAQQVFGAENGRETAASSIVGVR